jgi:hypothetical protein
MKPEDLVVGKEYIDKDFPFLVYTFKGILPEDDPLFPGEYQFSSKVLKTEEPCAILTAREVETDITEYE